MAQCCQSALVGTAGVVDFLWNYTRADDQFVVFGAEVQRIANDRDVVFIDIRAHDEADVFDYPQLTLYARRNLAFWDGQEAAEELIRSTGAKRGILLELDADDRHRVKAVRYLTPPLQASSN